MNRWRIMALWSLVAGTVLSGGCSSHSPRYIDDNTADHVRITVANKGPEGLFAVKVHIGDYECPLGGFGPGVSASRKVWPAELAVGRPTTLVIEYEDEDEQPHRLEGRKRFDIFPKGEIRVEIGGGKILDETIRPR